MPTKIYAKRRKIIFDESFYVNIVFFAVLVIGTVIGSILACSANVEDYQTVVEGVYNIEDNNSDRVGVFKESLLKYLKFIIIIWALGFFRFASVVSILLALLRSFGTGYMVSVCVIEFGLKGLWLSAGLFVIQNATIICLSLFVAGTDLAKIASDILRISGKTASKSNYDLNILERLVVLLIALVCVCLICAYEVYICPVWASLILR